MKLLAAPDTKCSEDVRACLESWSAAGLLEPFCWWPIGGSTPDQQVLLIEGRGPEQLALGEALRGKTNDADLIGVLAGETASEFSAEFVDGLVVANRRLLEVLPEAATYRPGRFLVVAVADPGGALPADLFIPAHANIVVSPQDRAHPDDSNQLPDNPGLVARHAAHAVACLAEIFKGSPKLEPRLLDAIAAELGHNDIRVQDVSCYTRLIDGGYLADHVAAEVLRPHDEEWPSPSKEKFERVEELSATRLDHLVRKFFEVHDFALGLSHFEPVPYKEPKLGLLEALKLAVRYLIDSLLGKPGRWLDAAVGGLYDRAAERIERLGGPGRGYSIIRWRPRLESAALVDTSDGLDSRPVIPDGSVKAAWDDLRSMGIGLIDGSSLPDFVDLASFTHDNRRIVLSNPSQIVPDPRKPPRAVMDEEHKRACDPLRIDPAIASGFAAGREEVDKVGDVTGGADGTDVQAQLMAFVKKNSKTLLWLVGARLAQNLVQARMTAEAPRENERTDEDEVKAEARLKRTERWIRRRFWVGTLLLTVLTGGAVRYEIKNITTPLSAAAVAGTGLLWLVALAMLAIHSHHRVRAKRSALVEERVREMNNVLLALQRSDDAIRLDRRYEEYLDWAEMIGWFAHRPWVGTPATNGVFAPQIDSRTLPNAFVVGTAVVGAQRMKLLTRQASNVVFQQGWLERVYSSVVEKFGRQFLSFEINVDDPEGEGIALPDPAADLSEDVDSFRRSLLSAVQSGECQRVTDSDLMEPLVDFLCGQPVDHLLEAVKVLETTDRFDGGALPPTPACLEPPPGLEVLATSLRKSVVRVRAKRDDDFIVGTGVVVDATGIVATSRSVIDRAGTLQVELPDRTWLEASVRAIDGDSDLGLLDLPSDRDYAAVEISGDEVVQGQPVVTIGYSTLAADEPALAWGIVTAPRHQINAAGREDIRQWVDVIDMTYRSPGGACGSPVVDTSGQLVAVHCRPSPPTEGDDQDGYLSSAIPVATVRSLLDGADSTSQLGHHDLRRVLPEQKPSSFLQEHLDSPDDVDLPTMELTIGRAARLVLSTIRRPESRLVNKPLPADPARDGTLPEAVSHRELA